MQEMKPAPVSRPTIRKGFVLILCLSLCMVFYVLAINRSATFFTIATNQSSLVDPHLLFRTIVTKLVEAGDRLVAIHESQGSEVLSTGSYIDGSVDLKTYADSVSSDILSEIHNVFPKLAMVDEEKYVTASQSPNPNQAQQENPIFRIPKIFSSYIPNEELAVYVDPLDATLEYSQNLTEYVTVSACVTRCGVPIAGIIYQPFSQRIYWARPGSGVQVHFSPQTVIDTEAALPSKWLMANKHPVSMGENGQCCTVTGREVLITPDSPSEFSKWEAQRLSKGIRAVVSRSRAQDYDEPAFSVAHSIRDTLIHSREYLELILGQSVGEPSIIPAGGAGYKVIQLLERTADVYLHPKPTRKWDTCAGEAILLESGGDLQDYFGRDIDYCVPRDVGHLEEDELIESVTVQGIIASGSKLLQRIASESAQKL